MSEIQQIFSLERLHVPKQLRILLNASATKSKAQVLNLHREEKKIPQVKSKSALDIQNNNLQGSSPALVHYEFYNKTNLVNKTLIYCNMLTCQNVLQTSINYYNISLNQGHWELVKLGHTREWKVTEEFRLPCLTALIKT